MNTYTRLTTLLFACTIMVGCDASPVPSTTSQPQRTVAVADPTPVTPSAEQPKPAPPAKTETKTDEIAPPLINGTIAEEEMEPTPIAAPTPPDTLKPLNMAKTLFIENRPEGRRLWIYTTVVNRDVPLELFMCLKERKEHEAIVSADVDARDIHMGLLAIGAKPGKTVQFVPDYTPATGEPIQVLVHYMKDGKPVTHPAQDWIIDHQTKKPMNEQWVFSGSRFLKDPDNPTAPPFYTANNGDVISVSNFVDSVLDLPVKSTDTNDSLAYRTDTSKIPPRKSGVFVILQRKN